MCRDPNEGGEPGGYLGKSVLGNGITSASVLRQKQTWCVWEAARKAEGLGWARRLVGNEGWEILGSSPVGQWVSTRSILRPYFVANILMTTFLFWNNIHRKYNLTIQIYLGRPYSRHYTTHGLQSLKTCTK